MRPTPATASDAPNPDKISYNGCVKEINSEGQCVIDTSDRRCANAYCDENLVVIGADLEGAGPPVSGPYEGKNPLDIATRHGQGWNNQFSFPYEVGMYWDFQVGEVSQRAIGCPGIDEPFGTIDEPLWPFKTKCCPIYGSPAMSCNVNMYAPEGKPMYQIVDELASDNELWAEKFLEAWHQMGSNGYADDQLVDGPQSGWVGHYSLTEQGVEISDFETFISENAPVTFTDPTVRKLLGLPLSITFLVFRLIPMSVGTMVTT